MFLRRMKRIPVLAQRLHTVREEQIPVTIRLAGPDKQLWVELQAAQVTEVGIDFVAFNNTLVKNKYIAAVAEISNAWVWDEGYALSDSARQLPPRWLLEALDDLQRERASVSVLAFVGQVEEITGTLRAFDNHYLIINTENDNRIIVRLDHVCLIGRRDEVSMLRETGALSVFSLSSPQSNWKPLQNQQSEASLEIEDLT